MSNIVVHLRRHWIECILAGIAVLSVALGLFTHLHPDNLTHVWFFDVGQGDASLIKTASNQYILIDGGPTDEVVGMLDAVMPMWHRKLDAVILTHPHSDHATGLLSVVDRYPIESFWYTGAEYNSETYKTLIAEVTKQDIPIQLANQNDNLSFGESKLEILFPVIEKPFSNDPNAVSIVNTFCYKNFSMLFTGDVPTSEEPGFIARVQDVDVIKVPHHGSRSASSNSLISAAKPEVGVIELGADNSFGHPHKEVIDRYQAAGIKLYRTDQGGTIEIVTDGQYYKVL